MRGFAAVAGMRRVTRVRRGRWCLRCGAAHGRRRRGDVAGVPGVAFTQFEAADVVRHPLVARIVEAYDAAGGKKP